MLKRRTLHHAVYLKLICGKRESMLLIATFDENWGAVRMLNLMRDKNESTCRGEKREKCTASVTTACCPEDC